MKKVIFILAFIFSSFSVSAQYQLHSSVFGGGSTSSGGSYVVRGSVSQPNVGLTECTSYSMKVGFWATYSNVALPPAFQASGIQFSNISRTGMTVSWTKGDGDGSLLLAKEQYRIASSPLTDGVVYNGASTVYSSAPTVGGAKMLYNGIGANPSIDVLGLTRYKLYYFKAFAYNNVASPYYLQTDGINNPRSRWTLRRDALMEEDLSIDAEYPYPNPVSNSITTTLDVFEEGRVTAKIYDIDGKMISELYNQALPFGTHQLTFDLSETPSGVYQIVISKGSEAVVYPISVVR